MSGPGEHTDGAWSGRNEIGGSAQIWGASVQAAEIRGGVHVHQAPQARPPVPRQLLSVPAHFTDRDADIAALEELRDARRTSVPQLVVVSGPAGVGKTALVSHWLRGIAEEYPDGQLYADLGAQGPDRPLRPGEVLDAFLRALGVGLVPVQLAEQAALWRSVSAGLRIAVMIDNALSAAQVRPLLNGAPGSLFVVSSRRRLTGLITDGAGFHQVDALDPAAALELLARGGGGSRVEQDPEAARQVVSQCAFLPLAVCLAAARLAARPRQPVAAMAAALARGRGPLELLRVEGESAVHTALDESYALLPPDAARAYRLLGLLPLTHYDPQLTAAVCAVSLDEAERLLDVLMDGNLLQDVGPDTYRFHDLVRLHAAGRAKEEPAPARRAALRHFLDWCLATTTAAEALLTPSHRRLDRDYDGRTVQPTPLPDQETALAWLDVRRLDLMAAVRLSAGSGHDDATAWQLVDAMWPLFLRLRPYDLWVEAHGLGLDAARRHGDRKGEGRMLTSGGNGLCHTGRYGEAVEWFDQALRLAEEDGDVRQQAQALDGLGKAHRGAGDLARAEEYHQQALDRRESIGHTRGAALSRYALGELALERGAWHTAAGLLAHAHTTLRAESDPYDAARALAHLGRATACAGDPAAGSRQLAAALEEFQRLGSVHWEARTWELLGQCAEDGGEPASARRSYERARALYEPLSPSDTHRLTGRLRHMDAGAGPG
ncbi:tetratricopeptide repeat protein [Streptomyces inhibens]|uniref:tetratricopeptide repeat protein n=1 Tax=Streptomyces inhibens TaxID=2293571 RepID=UPI001EE70DB9|nr:tetratricopeptide repeat protein [Streptomyces inhibens]UKY53889.1 tetratricopeptide repeat protein [Streptomyces inhibens]